MKNTAVHNKIRIMAVDTSTDLASRLINLLGKDAVDVCRETTIDRVLERFESEPYDVLVVTSPAFEAGEMDGIELLEVIAAKSPATQVLFLVEPRDIGTAMCALIRVQVPTAATRKEHSFTTMYGAMTS